MSAVLLAQLHSVNIKYILVLLWFQWLDLKALISSAEISHGNTMAICFNHSRHWLKLVVLQPVYFVYADSCVAVTTLPI